MGLSGASAAKRKAKRMAADAYYKALKGLKRADRLDRADTKAARTVEDSIGDDAGGNTRILARKADKVGQALNRDRNAFNEKVDRYNDRWDQLQHQMEGRPTGKRNADSSALVGWKQQRLAEIDAEANKLDAEESAYRATKSKIQTALQQFGGAKQDPLTDDQKARGKRLVELQQERSEVERGAKWIGNHYRHLNNLEDTYDEIATLAKEVGGYKRKGGLINQAAQEKEVRDLLDRTSTDSLLAKQGGGILEQKVPTVNASNLSVAGIKQKPFDPEKMELDTNSAGYRVTQTAEMYSGIADKLRTAVQRDAGRAAMNKIKQPVDQLGSDVIDPNANPVTAELLN